MRSNLVQYYDSEVSRIQDDSYRVLRFQLQRYGLCIVKLENPQFDRSQAIPINAINRKSEKDCRVVNVIVRHLFFN